MVKSWRIELQLGTADTAREHDCLTAALILIARIHRYSQSIYELPVDLSIACLAKCEGDGYHGFMAVPYSAY